MEGRGRAGIRLQSADEYLRRKYEIPAVLPALPLEDEPFAASWRETSGPATLDFLADRLHLPAFDFQWENREALKISFAQTLGGRLPVISTESHRDFRQMEALMSARKEAPELPMTVNAFTLEARPESIYRHRVLLLNYAPYSNIPADRLGLDERDWMERSHRLRQRHESAHYETLRLLGGMKNHALDEILADAMGQIAAFGDFDADRQRIFFGLTKGGDTCTGRLSFYTQRAEPEECAKIYRAVDEALELVADELRRLQKTQADDWKLLTALAGTSIAERLRQTLGREAKAELP